MNSMEQSQHVTCDNRLFHSTHSDNSLKHLFLDNDKHHAAMLWHFYNSGSIYKYHNLLTNIMRQCKVTLSLQIFKKQLVTDHHYCNKCINCFL